MSFLAPSSLKAPAKLRPENLQIGSDVPTGPKALRVTIPTAPKALRRSSTLPSKTGSALKRDSPPAPLSSRKHHKVKVEGDDDEWRNTRTRERLSISKKVKYEQACLELQEHPFMRKENNWKKVWNGGDEQYSLDREEITNTSIRAKAGSNDLSLFFPDATLARQPGPNNPGKIVPPEIEETTSEPIIASLTKEFWKLQMKMNALEENYREVMSSQTLPEPDGCNSNTSVQEQILEAENVLRSERKERIQMEWILKDVQRECSQPVIIPALLEALRASEKSTS